MPGPFLAKELLAADCCWRRIILLLRCGHLSVFHASSAAPPRYIYATLTRLGGYKTTTTTKKKLNEGYIKGDMEKTG